MSITVILIFLIGCSVAGPVIDIGEEGASRFRRSLFWSESIEEENGEFQVYMYPMEYNDRWDGGKYFYCNYECVERGHLGLSSEPAILKFRADGESPIDPDSSYTPIQSIHTYNNGEEAWMQIGNHTYGEVVHYAGQFSNNIPIPQVSKKLLYCYGGSPVEYTYTALGSITYPLIKLILIVLAFLVILVILVKTGKCRR